ncbi:MAG: DegT/DnrJ/EryC1/StrS family aminotransferase [Myxococcota bacterium]|nr:DegT/DnrJ/EryC1/StrS family aminotransferase [Myxococcota bacterium]
MKMRIPITKPVLDESDYTCLRDPIESGWVVQGPHVKRFEEKFTAFTGASDAMACTSCTTGLHLALAALDLGPGDEVIVPSFTWVASANVVAHCGATPILCDIDPTTFNIDPDDIEHRITERTKGIIPVHLFGLPADMDRVLTIAKRHDLFVVEDAACGLGAKLNGQHVGTIGDFGAFSFHPRKAITTGEGGMVLAKNPDHYALVRTLRDHGASRSDLARHKGKAAFLLSQFEHLGYNYRMTDIQGALGSNQMDKASDIISGRIQVAQRYDEILKRLPWLKTPAVPENAVHSYQSYVCVFAPETPTLKNLETLNEKRNHMLMAAEERGVSTRQGTHAIHGLGYYARTYGYEPHDLPQSWIAEHVTMTLPLYPQMTEAEQDYVVDVLEQTFNELR